MLRTSGLQSFRVLYWGGTDWGRPSWKFPGPPGDEGNICECICSWIIAASICRAVCVPEFFIEVEGVVHAALWQRPAEICLMFFPFRAEMSVGSFTGLACPRPSWNTNIKYNNTGFRVPLMCTESKLQIVKMYHFVTEDVIDYLSLTVAAPGIDVSSGRQSEDMFTTHSNVFYEQPLQRRHHLGVGFILQHGVRQADQTL